MGALDRAPHVELEDRRDWRRWLEDNHAAADGVWLVSWRTSSGRRGITYNVSVEEALCFGWIDGQTAVVDELRSRQYFAPRRPGSPWSNSNKERVDRLIRARLMAPAGLAAVERAKDDGSWSILDAAHRLELPPTLRLPSMLARRRAPTGRPSRPRRGGRSSAGSRWPSATTRA